MDENAWEKYLTERTDSNGNVYLVSEDTQTYIPNQTAQEYVNEHRPQNTDEPLTFWNNRYDYGDGSSYTYYYYGVRGGEPTVIANEHTDDSGKFYWTDLEGNIIKDRHDDALSNSLYDTLDDVAKYFLGIKFDVFYNDNETPVNDENAESQENQEAPTEGNAA